MQILYKQIDLIPHSVWRLCFNFAYAQKHKNAFPAKNLPIEQQHT